MPVGTPTSRTWQAVTACSTRAALRVHELAIPPRTAGTPSTAKLRHHEAVLRPLHPRDLRARLRAARRGRRPSAARWTWSRSAAVITAEARRDRIALTFPYVEGFGTWPFGEEWLFEAAATVYTPLLKVLDGPGGDRVTLSVTPVLADQLGAVGVHERLLSFLRDLRGDDARAGRRGVPHDGRAGARRRGGAGGAGLRGRRRCAGGAGRRRPRTPRSSATRRGPRRRPTPSCRCVATARACACSCGPGSASARASATWPGAGASGCPSARMRRGCIRCWRRPASTRPASTSRTSCPGSGRRSPRSDGPLLVPLDRETIELVWSPGGYPAAGAYRDSPPPDHPPSQPMGQRRGGLRPRPRARAGRGRRAHFVRRVQERTADGVAERLRAGHRAARPPLVRGPRLAVGGPGGGARAGLESCRSTPPPHAVEPRGRPTTSRRPRGASPARCGRGTARRSPTSPSRPATPSCARSRAASPARWITERSASCWHSNPPTGPSWSPATSRAPTRASARSRTSPRSTPPSRRRAPPTPPFAP